MAIPIVDIALLQGGVLMKLLAVFSVSLFLLSAPLQAEKPSTSSWGSSALISPGEVKATPEMWFYDQAMRQYNNPDMAIRVKADLRAQARQRRIESMRWFGMSNSRPRASSDPFNNDYSPQWVSSPGFYPSRWNGVSRP
jgi:hypothetical protein